MNAPGRSGTACRAATVRCKSEATAPHMRTLMALRDAAARPGPGETGTSMSPSDERKPTSAETPKHEEGAHFIRVVNVSDPFFVLKSLRNNYLLFI